MTTLVYHDIVGSNVSMGEDGHMGPREHAGKCVCVPSAEVMEIALVNACPYSLVVKKGRWGVIQALEERVTRGWRAVGQALIEMAQVGRARDRSPLGDHGPYLATHPLLGALIESIPHELEL
jgi:hypothetical protein